MLVEGQRAAFGDLRLAPGNFLPYLRDKEPNMPAIQVRSKRRRKGTATQAPTVPLIPAAPDDWLDDREVVEDKDMRVELWEQRLGDEPERTPSGVTKTAEGLPPLEPPE